MDTRDPMLSVTTETRREGGGGASGQKTKGNSPAFVAVSPQALGRAVSVPSQGSRLRQEPLISRVTGSSSDFLLQHQIYSPADHSPLLGMLPQRREQGDRPPCLTRKAPWGSVASTGGTTQVRGMAPQRSWGPA